MINTEDIGQFKDVSIKDATLAALLDCFGPEEKWGKVEKLSARKFINIMRSFTIDTLSLANLKASLHKVNGESRLHRVSYFFLCRIIDFYCADDKEEFRHIMTLLARSGRAYRVLFQPDVLSYNNLVYCTHYKQTSSFVG